MSTDGAALREREIVAIHDSWSAVIAARLGCRPSRFELHVRDLGDRWHIGGCVHVPDPPAGGYSDALTIAIAGRAAETDFGTPPRSHDPRDDAEIDRFLNGVSPPLAPKVRRQAIRTATSRARRLSMHTASQLLCSPMQ